MCVFVCMCRSVRRSVCVGEGAAGTPISLTMDLKRKVRVSVIAQATSRGSETIVN